jgi:hypothetical protein
MRWQKSWMLLMGLALGLPGLAAATGEVPLIDASGLEWFINTNTTADTSSASGAVSDATYTQAVAATTANGGTVLARLRDAFDGYNALCISTNGNTGPCDDDDPDFTVYTNNGVGSLECGGRQVVLNPQTIGNLEVFRKIFVPANDTFARWLNFITNTGSSRITVTVVTFNNLGSDSATRIVTTSDGDAIAERTDTWVTTFQDFSGTTSSDPRLGHVLRAPGGRVALARVSFTNGDDNPFWAYTFTLEPKRTGIIMNFATGQPSKAAAAAKADQLARLRGNALDCMNSFERARVLNFRIGDGQ